MNERIQELVKQCYETGPIGKDGWPEYSRLNEQKFAELIVQKCVEQASIGNGHGNNQWDRALTFAAKNIKEHFGVE